MIEIHTHIKVYKKMLLRIERALLKTHETLSVTNNKLSMCVVCFYRYRFDDNLVK